MGYFNCPECMFSSFGLVYKNKHRDCKCGLKILPHSLIQVADAEKLNCAQKPHKCKILIKHRELIKHSKLREVLNV
jgi:hypothetical protein